MAKPKKGEVIIPSRPQPAGPYLTTALIAEKLLREVDGVVTIVRVVDQVVFPPGSFELSEQKVGLNLTIVISFKAGGFKGSSRLLLTVESPSGHSEPIGLHPNVQFNGEQASSVNLVYPVILAINEEGIYWFDVFLDETFITRIPLTIKLD